MRSAARVERRVGCSKPCESPFGIAARQNSLTSTSAVGVGVLQHELAEIGATRTTAVEASRPYLELLQTAAAERGYEAQQVLVEGRFHGGRW